MTNNMTSQQEHDFYADPANQQPQGAPRRYLPNHDTTLSHNGLRSKIEQSIQRVVHGVQDRFTH